MSVWDTVRHWASTAWHDFTGAVSDPVTAFQSLWKFVSTVNTTQQWLMRFPLWRQLVTMADVVQQLVNAVRMIGDALDRIGAFVRQEITEPLRRQLLAVIRADRARERRDVWVLQSLIWRVQQWLVAYVIRGLAVERSNRRSAVAAARRYAAAVAAAALAAVQREATTAYATGLKGRLSVVERIIEDLAGRNPLVKDVESKAITAIIDLASIEDPALKLLIGFLVNRIVASAGTDTVAGDLLKRLVGPLVEDTRPKTLYGVIKDVSARLGALEQQQQQFMADGGPEVENAGRQWNAITSLAADAAILAFTGQAVIDPAAWAAEITTVAGGPANDILTGIVNLTGGT